jgi:hypothetical protein
LSVKGTYLTDKVAEQKLLQTHPILKFLRPNKEHSSVTEKEWLARHLYIEMGICIFCSQLDLDYAEIGANA